MRTKCGFSCINVVSLSFDLGLGSVRSGTIESVGSIPSPKTNRRILDVLNSLAKSQFLYKRDIMRASFLEVCEI